MAQLAGSIWEYNFAKVVFVDVSDDYRLSQPPMPSTFYPVLKEEWLPTLDLPKKLATGGHVEGFLYDWHERGQAIDDSWYVGVVAADLTS